jgi:hypothetical protein
VKSTGDDDDNDADATKDGRAATLASVLFHEGDAIDDDEDDSGDDDDDDA